MDEKILVIEDDPGTLRLMVYSLQHEGYQVISAANGLEGLRKAQEEEPDLVVLDVMLPGIDGYEVCHRLRAEPHTAHLPILMLSGKAQETDKATGLKVGADDYIAKPVSPSETADRVRKLLAERRQKGNMTIG
jgi:DNA-binding response OmpR family regulator